MKMQRSLLHVYILKYKSNEQFHRKKDFFGLLDFFALQWKRLESQRHSCQMNILLMYSKFTKFRLSAVGAEA